ncbi:uncharacterized protein [Rutidosis leptorrhynchoides]|uniref:uncharacterized protein isoform X1 n=1 Tax=Rutidosis leptorrhynchoides TaxID=125765 RepID=UPI003A997DCD
MSSLWKSNVVDIKVTLLHVCQTVNYIVCYNDLVASTMISAVNFIQNAGDGGVVFIHGGYIFLKDYMLMRMKRALKGCKQTNMIVCPQVTPIKVKFATKYYS